MEGARTAVVTGSSSGIGEAIARRLAETGWQVVGLDLAPRAGAPYLAAQHAVDLTDADATRAAAAELRGAAALVHAAGFMRTGTLEALDPVDGTRMWTVHVGALTILAQALLPAMGMGGRLLAIGSRTSRGAAAKGQYAAVKAAVVGLVRSLAIEAAGRGVTANVISPAATATPLLSNPDRIGTPPVLPPIGRYVLPEEVAAYAAFILSPEAAAITGQELFICGGGSL